MSSRSARNSANIHEDTGCDSFPKCATCPLPRCKYEAEDAGIYLKHWQAAVYLKAHPGTPLGAVVEATKLGRRLVRLVAIGQGQVQLWQV